MVANILLAVSGSIIFLLGLLTYVSNPHKRVNRSFFAFTLCGFVWLLTNLFSNISGNVSYSLLFARMSAGAAALIGLTFLIFTLSYVNDKRLTRLYILKLSIAPIIILLATPTSLNISSIDAYARNVKTGPLYYVLIPVLAIYFIRGFVVLFKYYKKATAIQKARLRYLFAGFVLTIVPGVIVNGILPVLGSDEASFYGPNIVVILAFFMTMAIARVRLLDIRLVAIRSLVYTLIIFTIAAIFFGGAFGVSTLTSTSDELSTPIQITYIGLALLLAFVFQPLKSFFDKLSNRYFYRDAYSSEDFLGVLNRTLVNNVDIDILISKTRQIIEEYLKSSSILFDLNKTAYVPRRIVGNNPVYKEGDIELLHDARYADHDRILIVDNIDTVDPKLYELLQKRNISLIVKLATTLEYNIEGFGYLLLGPKRSGNPYTKQDINVIKIMGGELAIAIQNALRFEEIEKFNITLQEKIDDSTRRLRRSNDKLKALDETKDEFISMASHQLRTPLTSVKGYVSMVLEGDAGELKPMQRKLLEQSFASSQRMVYLIADLLNLSRLRTGKFVIEAKPTNLAEVIESEVEQLKVSAAGRNLTLDYKKPEGFPSLMIDETKIRQVIMNFADNAIYYTPAGGAIEIKLKQTKDSVEFTVNDNGIGIPAAEQHHLFNKFYRAKNAQKARPDGTGLGLFMAKKVIIAQGGAIVFKSVENKGSTFGFTFSKQKLKIPDYLQTQNSPSQ